MDAARRIVLWKPVLILSLAAFAALLLLQVCSPLETVGLSSRDYERRAKAVLMEYASAQASFFSIVKEREGRGSYWRKDIAGLHRVPGADGKERNLIGIEIAASDLRPLVRVGSVEEPTAWKTYNLCSISFQGEVGLSPDVFAAVAIPGPYNTHPWIYVITDSWVIYKKPFLDRRIPDELPKDLEKSGWTRVDMTS